MCLAHGHRAVTPVRLELTSHRSRVKYSTTESLRSLNRYMHNVYQKLFKFKFTWVVMGLIGVFHDYFYSQTHSVTIRILIKCFYSNCILMAGTCYTDKCIQPIAFV